MRPNRFNGATTLESWKTGSTRRSSRRSWPLQWGHDTGVVEDLLDHKGRAARRLLRWGHDTGVVEDTCFPVPSSTVMTVLQWGHDTGVVEDEDALHTLRASDECFNGATTLESWKTGRRWCALSPANDASMGPRHWSRGRPLASSVSPKTEVGFNGATTLESWKTPKVRKQPSR